MKRTLPITSPIYQRRQHVPRYSVPMGPLSFCAPVPRALRMLRRRLPDWNRDDHARQATALQRLADAARRAWSREVDAAALETFGRPFQATDYRVSGIGSDDFAPARKERLRHLAHRRTDYLTARDLHTALAGPAAMRREKKKKG